ncbi:MAG: lysophospholipid acyltransferase family protein [Deltaproteobacteria bacterium]|nr:lysophospholipid acyltransferase family protein [Deltaproteobacteria bacterium]
MPRSRRRGRRFRHRLEYVGLRLVTDTLGALPLAVAMRLAAAVAALVIRVARPLRRIGLRNLAIAFPEKSEAERAVILAASYRNLGRMVAECAHLPELTARNLGETLRFDEGSIWDTEIVPRLQSGGVMILTGHFGNWEMFAYAYGLLGYPVSLVHQTIKNPLVDGYIERLRSGGGTRLFRKQEAARAVLRALKERSIVVLPLDQNQSRRAGIFVDFFGLPANTSDGLARIALRNDTPIYPAFLVRDGTSARHHVVFLPRVEFPVMADADSAARELTQRCTAVLESMIRDHPDHWLWTHKRWRTRPLGEPEVYEA